MTEKNVYQLNGYKDRDDYLAQLGDNLGIGSMYVNACADLLGESEDFDGLVSELEDAIYLGLI